jgi:hypothetical protein
MVKPLWRGAPGLVIAAEIDAGKKGTVTNFLVQISMYC